VVVVTKALFSIGDCAFDGGSDKAHPCCKFSALQFHAFFEIVGLSKIGLSHARSKSCLEYNASTRNRNCSMRLRSFSSLSRP
jgi:hypothetical protein